MYKNVIFDLDGTLINSEPGIVHSCNKAMADLGLDVPKGCLKGAIGQRLPDIFSLRLGVPDKDIDLAVRLYREEYSAVGLQLSELYPGVLKLLSTLKERGTRICAATLKAEYLAVKIIEYLEIKDYFEIITGVDNANTLRKPDLIKKCLGSFALNKCAMVGDSVSDGAGALESGVDFIGVTYGYGFETIADIKPYHPKFVAAHPEELLKFLS